MKWYLYAIHSVHLQGKLDGDRVFYHKFISIKANYTIVTVKVYSYNFINFKVILRTPKH